MCQDGAVIKALCTDSCVCDLAAAEGCRSAVALSLALGGLKAL